jgi:hypothetical protein
MELYAGGRRRLLPPLLFGLGVACALLRHGKRYDVVHNARRSRTSRCSRPRLPEAERVPHCRRLARALDARHTGGGTPGASPAGSGWRVQRACIAVPQRAFCFSRLHERRLREQGFHW